MVKLVNTSREDLLSFRLLGFAAAAEPGVNGVLFEVKPESVEADIYLFKLLTLHASEDGELGQEPSQRNILLVDKVDRSQ